MPRPSSLALPATELVLAQLRQAAGPMSAYMLLEKLRPSGIRSAPIIYRALESLCQQGQVHKIRELSTYIACDCSDDHRHSLSVLAVCGQCQEVEELHDHAIIHQLEKLRQSGVRLQKEAVIELPVTCQACVQ